MWSGWAEAVADGLESAIGAPIRVPLFAMFGYDPVARRARPGGGLISTPMARLREMTADVLVAAGIEPTAAERALADTWHAPDPVTLVHPLADLTALFEGLRASGRRVAVATSDDRDPTLRTLAALRLDPLVDAVVCADDGVPNKPAPDPVLHVCRELGVAPGRSAVVGDSPADLAMGRAAGAGLVIGVRTGVGEGEHLAAADVVIDSVAALV
jgi:phosphoglycolate phosphatase